MSVGLRVEGLPEFDSAVDAWFGAVEKVAAKAAVVLTNRVFDNILINSPQFSGDMTSSWRVSFNGYVDGRFEKNAIPGAARYGEKEKGVEPFGRVDAAAIQHAYSQVTWPSDFKLGTPIYISNSATHDEPYAWLVEDGKIKFRPENAGADHVCGNAVKRVAARFSTGVYSILYS